MSNIINMKRKKEAEWIPIPRKLQWYGSYVRRYAIAMTLLEREVSKILEQTRIDVSNMLD